VLLPYTAEGVAFEGARHPEALKQTRRFYPHRAMGEGQFIALFKKNASDEKPRFSYPDASVRLNKTEEKTVYEFLENVLSDEGLFLVKNNFSLVKHKDSVFLKNALPLPPRFVYMAGVCIGELTKGRIEPHHQFFSAFGDLFARKESLALESEALAKYLRGETFETTLSNGYASVLVNGCALGGIKAVNGTAKNHYPKGLRIH
jgi:NOL1/NOP2/fmu family ribosome biogenesis protein